MRFLAGFFALLLFASCAAGQEDATPARLEGTVTNLSIEDGTVTGFDLVSEEDGIVTILVDPERDYGFDLLHLEEHQSTGDPVVVSTETKGEDVIAVGIDDV